MSNQPPEFAQYPRPSQEPGFQQYGRGPGVYFEAIGEAWNLVMKDLGTWVAATLVYFAATYGLSLPLSFLTQPLFEPFKNAGSNMNWSAFSGVFVFTMLLNLIPISVTATLGVGMISMGVKKVRGEYINVGMIFEPFKRFGVIFGAALLYYLVSAASGLACLLPLLFFGPVLYLMPTVAYLRGVGPVESLSLTFDACKSHWLGLLGLFILLWLVLFVGTCACFIGLLLAFPTFCLVLAIHYRAFFESTGLPYVESPAL